MGLRDVGFYLRGRLNSRIARALNARRSSAPPTPVATIDDVIRSDDAPLALSQLLEGRERRQQGRHACALVVE